MSDQEIEVKLYVRDLKKVEAGLLERQARLIQARVFERNLRFDQPDGRLRAAGCVLRLRQDTEARLTYKGASNLTGGIMTRPELEFTIGDLETARKVLLALGYEEVAVYEKYRTVYDLEGCHIMLDELPYGDFVEIEGTEAAAIRQLTDRLGLRMDAAVGDSYLGIFDKYCQKRGWSQSILTFEALRGVVFNPSVLNLRAADLPA
ncbi:MAG: class IV adenylate cyclase [Chloroflexota bacterium]